MEIYEFYEVHLIPKLFINLCGESDVWCNSWLHSPASDLPKDAVSTIEKCDADALALPCIDKLLPILCTMPVTTACAERSFSCLIAPQTWLRARLGEERLSCLALMRMHPERIALADLDNVINVFALKKPGRLNIIL